MDQKLLVHGTTVAIGDRAVLLRGPSGSGKSDLALRFISGTSAWPFASGERRLVADDQTQLTLIDGTLVASSPPTIAGKLEVRGVGIVGVPAIPMACLQLVVDLVSPDTVGRLPDDATTVILGCCRPHRLLAPFEASAAMKLALLLDEAIQMER